MAKDQDKEWSNNEELGTRTKIALRILLLMVKVVAPYRWEHEYKKEIEAVDKAIVEHK